MYASMIKHSETSHRFASYTSVLLVGGGMCNDRSIADCIAGSRKATNMRQKLAEKNL